jgi:hypothetical protein
MTAPPRDPRQLAGAKARVATLTCQQQIEAAMYRARPTASEVEVAKATLFRSGQGWNTFVVENGLAKRREVEAGRHADFEVEVLNGLREGESVIAHPSNLVADGVRVSVDENDRRVL